MDLSAQPRAEQGSPIFFTVMLALLHLKKHLFGPLPFSNVHYDCRWTATDPDILFASIRYKSLKTLSPDNL
jgi:hypothetical protein